MFAATECLPLLTRKYHSEVLSHCQNELRHVYLYENRNIYRIPLYLNLQMKATLRGFPSKKTLQNILLWLTSNVKIFSRLVPCKVLCICSNYLPAYSILGFATYGP